MVLLAKSHHMSLMCNITIPFTCTFITNDSEATKHEKTPKNVTALVQLSKMRRSITHAMPLQGPNVLSNRAANQALSKRLIRVSSVIPDASLFKTPPYTVKPPPYPLASPRYRGPPFLKESE